MFIRLAVESMGYSEGEECKMFDVTTIFLAGLGGASLGAAFLEYKLSRKSKTK